MYNLICNNKGMSLVEVLIAIIITVIGLLSVLSLQPSGYILSTKSDQLGRAAMILKEELETQEVRIMNECNNPIATGTSTKTVYSSGPSSGGTGDISYTVQTTITSIDTNIWRVNVRVTGPNTNIAESLIVTRQAYFKQGC